MSIIDEIKNGGHDDALTDIISTAEWRRQHIEPWDGLDDVLKAHFRLRQAAGQSLETKARVSVELVMDLRKLREHPSEIVRDLAQKLLRKVYIEGLNMSPSSIENMEV